MVGNTGTYLDSPFHRFAAGDDLAAVPLAAVVDLLIHVLRITHRRDVGVEDLAHGLADVDLAGAAVLLHTGGDRAWGSEAYAELAPFLTADGARWLAQRRPQSSASTRSTSTISTTPVARPTPCFSDPVC